MKHYKINICNPNHLFNDFNSHDMIIFSFINQNTASKKHYKLFFVLLVHASYSIILRKNTVWNSYNYNIFILMQYKVSISSPNDIM